MQKNAILFKHNDYFKNISKQQNTATSQQLQCTCVNLQLAHGVWNFVEETEEMVNRGIADREF